MNDGIIKGDGTSRLIRSVSDFKVKYPTYDSFIEALVAGTLPVDVLFNQDGWSQEPDFLNKANLLKDETATLFKGLPENPVPDDVLQILSKAVLVGSGDSLITPDGSGVQKAAIELISYVGTNTVGASTPTSIRFSSKPSIAIMLGYSATDDNASGDGRFWNTLKSGVPTVPIGKLSNSFKAGFGFTTGDPSMGTAPKVFAKYDDSTNTLSWYINGAGPNVQFNAQNTTYYCIGLGVS